MADQSAATVKAPRQHTAGNGPQQHQPSDGSDVRNPSEYSRQATDSMAPAAQPGPGRFGSAQGPSQSQPQPPRGLAGPRGRRQRMQSHRAQYQGFPGAASVPHEHMQNTESRSQPRRDGPAAFQYPQPQHAPAQHRRPYQGQPPVQPHDSYRDSMPFPNQRPRFQTRPPAHAAGPALGEQHQQHFRSQPARPSVRPADRRRASPTHALQSTESVAAKAQQDREQSIDSSVICLESSEPSVVSLSLNDHSDGQAASSRQSRPQQGQQQAGQVRQSRRASSQNGQAPTGLAQHTEEHLARLLADSRRATAAQPSPRTSSVPTKRKGQTHSAVPYKKEASAVGTAATAGSSVNPAELNDDYGVCVICAEQRQIVAVGCCNHKAVCACCCLRMRLKYSDNSCPLCKQDQPQVIMTAWAADGVADWEALQGRRDAMWQKPSWAKGVLVDNASPSTAPRALFRAVQDITAFSCAICDPDGGHPKPSMKMLQQHMLEQHSRHLCSICIKADNVFPLELGHFTSTELQRHEQLQHPLCSFCNVRMYSGDDLFEHMRSTHFTCDVCQRGGAFVHFDNADTLVTHLRNEHHLCTEPECEYCFVAYATPEELRQHRLQVHSRAMPRFDRSRARLLDLSDAFPAHNGLPSHPRSRDADGRSDRRAQGRQRGRQNRLPGRGPPSAAAGSAEAHSNGMVMIDDDLGMSSAPFPDLAAGPRASGSAPPSRAASQARQRQAGPSTEEAFPELRAQVRSGDDSAMAQEARPAPVRRPQPPPLQKVTLKCPCGRRVSHTAVPAGQRPGVLTCDAKCGRQKRSSRLANAFGIEDPDHHVPWVDRQPREVQWSAELLHYAWHHKAKVRDMEAQLADFTSSAQKRRSLPSVPKQERHVMHQLAAAYGLSSQSFGSEPARHVDLFKVAAAGFPKTLLSQAAACSTLEELERALRSEKGFLVAFTDVASFVDLHRILYQWEGQFVLSGPFADGEATARFTTPEAAKEALDMLGGGVRGQYRVNRAASWNPTAASRQRKAEQPAQASMAASSNSHSRPPVHALGAGISSSNGNSRLPQQRPGIMPAVNGLGSLAQAERPVQGRQPDAKTFHASDLAFEEPAPARTTRPTAK